MLVLVLIMLAGLPLSGAILLVFLNRAFPADES